MCEEASTPFDVGEHKKNRKLLFHYFLKGSFDNKHITTSLITKDVSVNTNNRHSQRADICSTDGLKSQYKNE